MTTLTEFLLARIAEDEADARKAMPGPWTSDGGVYAGHPTNEVVDYTYEDNADHIARWDPARVLAECDAKRRIVVRCREMQSASVPMAVHLATRTLADLALPYANHPSYDPAWRP